MWKCKRMLCIVGSFNDSVPWYICATASSALSCACAFLQAADCPSRGFTAHSTSCSREDPKAASVVCLNVSASWSGSSKSHAVVIDRKSWMQSKTLCFRREPILAEDFTRHCVLQIELTDLNAVSLLRGTAHELGTNICPECPQSICDLSNHSIRRFTTSFSFWLIFWSGIWARYFPQLLLVTIQALFHLLLGSEARVSPQPLLRLNLHRHE